MRYFNVDQIYADLITGRTTRTLVYSSLVRARKRGDWWYTKMAALTRDWIRFEALRVAALVGSGWVCPVAIRGVKEVVDDVN